jgi:hypothetical protein
LNQRRITFLLFYVVSAISIAVTMGRAHWLPYYRLVSAGTSTQAVVTQTSCADRSTFSYRFTASGQTIDGRGDAGYGNPPCSALKPGNQVEVAYLDAAPQINLPGDPRERLSNETFGIALAAVFLPLVILVILFLLQRRRQKE